MEQEAKRDRERVFRWIDAQQWRPEKAEYAKAFWRARFHGCSVERLDQIHMHYGGASWKEYWQKRNLPEDSRKYDAGWKLWIKFYGFRGGSKVNQNAYPWRLYVRPRIKDQVDSIGDMEMFLELGTETWKFNCHGVKSTAPVPGERFSYGELLRMMFIAVFASDYFVEFLYKDEPEIDVSTLDKKPYQEKRMNDASARLQQIGGVVTIEPSQYNFDILITLILTEDQIRAACLHDCVSETENKFILEPEKDIMDEEMLEPWDLYCIKHAAESLRKRRKLK